MSVFDITTLPATSQLGGIFKIGILTLLLLFLVFLVVILTQVRSMNKVITQPNIYPFLLIAAWLLIILALALFLLAIAIL